jgi:hypothetical protein
MQTSAPQRYCDRGSYLQYLCGALVYMLDLGVVDRGFYLRCLCGGLVYMLDLGVVDRGFYLQYLNQCTTKAP